MFTFYDLSKHGREWGPSLSSWFLRLWEKVTWWWYTPGVLEESHWLHTGSASPQVQEPVMVLLKPPYTLLILTNLAVVSQSAPQSRYPASLSCNIMKVSTQDATERKQNAIIKLVSAMFANTAIPLTISWLIVSAYFQSPTLGPALFWLYFLCIYPSWALLPVGPTELYYTQTLSFETPASYSAIQRCSEKETF